MNTISNQSGCFISDGNYDTFVELRVDFFLNE